MKQLIFILSIMPVVVFGQIAKDTVKKAGITNLEIFSEKSGSLIQKEFIDIGSIVHGGLYPEKYKIQLEIITDLMNDIKLKGVRLEYKYINTDEKIGFLDADEIDAALKAIKIIQTSIIPKTEDNYTEVEFTSRGGFSLGCYYKGNHWQFFLKVNSYSSIGMLKSDDIDNLYSLFQEAKSKL